MESFDTLFPAGPDAVAAAAPPVPDAWPPFSRERDERQLVARLRAGDHDAFETLVRREGARLLVRARPMLGHDEDARDAVQDACLSAYRSLGRLHRRPPHQGRRSPNRYPTRHPPRPLSEVSWLTRTGSRGRAWGCG